MAMMGYTAYITYIGIKTHFCNKSYNYFRHKGAKITEGALQKHRDRYWFIRLQDRYSDKELETFFLSQFTQYNHSYWVGDSFCDVCQDSYTNHKKKIANLTRTFNREMRDFYEKFPDCETMYQTTSGYPKIITEYMADRLSLETVIMLDDINAWTVNNPSLEGILGAPILNKINKYRPFLNYNIDPVRKNYNELNFAKQ
jgi:uncharacterized protein (DUF2461 family)